MWDCKEQTNPLQVHKSPKNTHSQGVPFCCFNDEGDKMMSACELIDFAGDNNHIHISWLSYFWRTFFKTCLIISHPLPLTGRSVDQHEVVYSDVHQGWVASTQIVACRQLRFGSRDTHTDTRDKMRRKEHLFLFVLASSKKPWPYWLIWQDNDGIIAVYFILYLWTPLLRRMQPGSEAHPRSSSMVFPSDPRFKSERETQAATVTAEPSWAHLITEGAGVGHFFTVRDIQHILHIHWYIEPNICH